MSIWNYFTKQAPQVETKGVQELNGLTRETKDADIFKAYIPNFLYKPPYGMPRRDNTVQFKMLAKNPYVFSVIKTLCDEITSSKWEIKVKEEFQEDGKDYTDKIKEITQFLQNPNGNEQSFQHILRQVITDILEVDSGVIVKVFNSQGELKQIFARDGSLFLKNPDIYGYMGDRADFVLPLPDGFTGVAIDLGGTPNPTQQQIMKHYSLLYKDQAAYFQYGWTAGSMPVPFGKREIIYMMQMPRADSIYGTSPVGILMEIILNLIYGAEFNLDFYTNNNMPEGAITLLGAQPDQIKQFRENFEGQFKFTDNLGNKRKRFFKTPISTTPIDFTPFTLSAKEMEVIAQQEWFTKILWMCFGVTADEMGFTEDSNKAEGETQVKLSKRKAIKPLIDVISYHLNSQLLTEFFTKDSKAPEFGDIPLEFVFDDYDIDEEKKNHDLLEQEIRMGVKTPLMAAKELGINVDELEEGLEKQKEENIEMMKTESSLGNEKKEQDKPKTKPVEKKSIIDDPLKDINQYIDNVGDDISKAIGDLDARELRI